MNKGLLVGLLGVLGLALFSNQSKANDNFITPDVLPPNNTNDKDLVITTHDNAWDYMRKANVWFTKKKGTNAWINMQTALSPQNYSIAINRLNEFIKKNRM